MDKPPVEKTGEGYIDSDELPLVEPKIYELAFLDYSTMKLFGGRSHKLCLRFRVISLGKAFGKIIIRYYNVKAVKGRPGKNGDFIVGWKCDFIREYAALFGLPQRKDRVSMTCFKSVIIIGRVKTVTTGFNQKQLHKDVQYSVISELVKVKSL